MPSNNIPDVANLLEAPVDCDVVALGEEGLLFRKQHAYPGQFRMKSAKGPIDFELTEEDIREIAQESQRYIDNGNQSNLPIGHTEDAEKNRGHNIKWFAEKDSKGRLGLFSITEFRDTESAKLARTAQTSLYLPATYEDGAKHKYVRPALHVALTDRPVIPGLDRFTPIAASLVTIPITESSSMPKLKDLAESIGLQLSETIIVDEQLTVDAITAAFEETSAKAKDAELKLSEYMTLNPPKSEPAKVSKAQVSMYRENRELKLSQLVEKGKILPCVSKKLQEVFCDTSALTLSLSLDKEDNFDSIIAALADNDPIKLSEQTGPQATDLSLLLSEATNPMIAAANKKRERAGIN